MWHCTHHCPARWLGILNALGTIDKNWEHLLLLKKDLIDQGFGPTQFPAGTCSTPKCKKRLSCDGGPGAQRSA